MGCHSRDLAGRKRAADPTHLAKGIVDAATGPPGEELRFQIGGRLAGKRRISGAGALSGLAVALGTGLQATLGIAQDAGNAA